MLSDFKNHADITINDNHNKKNLCDILPFDAVAISDMHFPKDVAQAERLLQFLEALRQSARESGRPIKKLFLVGDVIDGWYREMHKHKHGKMTEMQMRVFDCINAMGVEGTELIYLPGNHDENLRKRWFRTERINRKSEKSHNKPAKMERRKHKKGDISGARIKILGQDHVFTEKNTSQSVKIHVANYHIHQDASGRKTLLLHGDQFDPQILKSGVGDKLSRVSDNLYDFVLKCERWAIGLEKEGAVTDYLKQKAKSIFTVQQSAHRRATALTLKDKFDAVIIGHHHKPCLNEKNGKIIANTGDWIGSCTALGFTHDGKMQMVEWKKISRELNLKIPTETDINKNLRFRGISEMQMRMVQKLWPSSNQDDIEKNINKSRLKYSDKRIQAENNPGSAYHEYKAEKAKIAFNSKREKSLPYRHADLDRKEGLLLDFSA